MKQIKQFYFFVSIPSPDSSSGHQLSSTQALDSESGVTGFSTLLNLLIQLRPQLHIPVTHST